MKTKRSAEERLFDCRAALAEIKSRRITAQQEFSRSLQGKHWSQLAGYDGIDVGLMMAEQALTKALK